MGRKNRRFTLTKGKSPKWDGTTLEDIMLPDGSKRPTKYVPMPYMEKTNKKRRNRT